MMTALLVCSDRRQSTERFREMSKNRRPADALQTLELPERERQKEENEMILRSKDGLDESR